MGLGLGSTHQSKFAEKYFCFSACTSSWWNRKKNEVVSNLFPPSISIFLLLHVISDSLAELMVRDGEGEADVGLEARGERVVARLHSHKRANVNLLTPSGPKAGFSMCQKSRPKIQHNFFTSPWVRVFAFF